MEAFELGIFSPGSTKNHYLGIWYKKISVKTIVWVANRLNCINDCSCFFDDKQQRLSCLTQAEHHSFNAAYQHGGAQMIHVLETLLGV